MKVFLALVDAILICGHVVLQVNLMPPLRLIHNQNCAQYLALFVPLGIVCGHIFQAKLSLASWKNTIHGSLHMLGKLGALPFTRF